MKRLLYNKLLDWKHDPSRKPLLLQGARQVGKTWLITEFGRNEYEDFVYLNFEQDPDLSTIFSGKLDPDRIIEDIGLYIGRSVKPQNTLICFDEIQTTPSVLTSLKYFQEFGNIYHIIAAGSLLGVSVAKAGSFPVGKVNFMTLYPMSFTEYLVASGEELLAKKLDNMNPEDGLTEVIHEKLNVLLKKYLFLGGMPEVLKNYLNDQDASNARKTQNEILKAYERDFSKYTEKKQAIKTSELWHSIPRQLSRENKKFKYKDIRNNARASAYEQTIEWLRKAGLIHVAYQVSAPKIPLSAYADYSAFKTYLLDTGLLGAMLNIASELIIKPNELFTEFNGASIENFVAIELMSSGFESLNYWSSNSKAEVDFLVQLKNNIYPVEVKSGYSKHKKSLKVFEEKFNPKFVIRCSPRNFIREEKFINLPLYAAFRINTLN